MDDDEGTAGRWEKLAGLLGFITAGLIALICVDLLTDGALAAALTRRAAALGGEENPGDCGC